MKVNKAEVLQYVNSVQTGTIELDDLNQYFMGNAEVSNEFSQLATELIFDDNAPAPATYLKSELLVSILANNPSAMLAELFGDDKAPEIGYILDFLDRLEKATSKFNPVIDRIKNGTPVMDELCDRQMDLLLRILIVLLVADIPDSGILYTLMRPMQNLDTYQSSPISNNYLKFTGSIIHKILVMLTFKLAQINTDDKLTLAITQVVTYLTNGSVATDKLVKSLVE